MKKDLPNIFRGKVSKSVNQKETVINRYIREDIIPRLDEKENSSSSVSKQISEIFNSESFIYKADTLITLYSGDKIKKTIIGKNNNSLITMDDDLIDINSIKKIERI